MKGRVYEKLRYRFMLDFVRKARETRQKGKRRQPEVDDDQAATLYMLDRAKARKAFGKTPDSERIAVLKSLHAEEKDRDQIFAAELRQAIALLEHRASEKETESSMGGQMYAAKVWMVTYQDESFVLESLSVGERGARLDTEALVNAVKEEPNALTIFKDFEAFGASLQEQFPKLEVVMKAELCLDTYARRGICRLHLHMALGRQPRLGFDQSALEFRKIVSHSNPVQGMSFSTNKVKKAGYQAVRNQCFYYVSADKLGSVWASGSLRPHLDYSVNPAWVSALLEASALSFVCRASFSF